MREGIWSALDDAQRAAVVSAKDYVRWFVSLELPARDAVWTALDDAHRAAVVNTKEYRNMLAVEGYNDLVEATELWEETLASDMFDMVLN